MRSEKAIRLGLESLGDRVMPSAVAPVDLTHEAVTAAVLHVRKQGGSQQEVSSSVVAQPAIVEKWFLGQ